MKFNVFVIKCSFCWFIYSQKSWVPWWGARHSGLRCGAIVDTWQLFGQQWTNLSSAVSYINKNMLLFGCLEKSVCHFLVALSPHFSCEILSCMLRKSLRKIKEHTCFRQNMEKIKNIRQKTQESFQTFNSCCPQSIFMVNP